jgi:hypothetical protein
VESSSGALSANPLLKRSMCISMDLTLPSWTRKESATNTLSWHCLGVRVPS